MHRNTQLLVLASIIVAGVLLGRAFLQETGNTPDASLPAEIPQMTSPSISSTPPPATEQPVEPISGGVVGLWSASSTTLNIDIPAAQSDIEGAVLLEYDTTVLRSLQRGDSLLIEVPQKNSDYQVYIEKVVNHPGGIKVIQARQSDNVRLILTLGEKNTFANLATLDGNFELVGNTTAGWLMPAENMDPNLDPSIPDYVILPRARQQVQAKRQTLN